jgi:hypothetical protein
VQGTAGRHVSPVGGNWARPETLLFIGLWIWLLNRNGGGLGGMFSFGSSKAKKYEPTKETVTFADVAGIDEAKEELAEIVDFPAVLSLDRIRRRDVLGGLIHEYRNAA